MIASGGDIIEKGLVSLQFVLCGLRLKTRRQILLYHLSPLSQIEISFQLFLG